ncbi:MULTISPECIES: FxLYD domain-containing protein [Pantoea]|uniref:Uncharacterized protein n=1 Tax=Candidatus Pantoea multigeneris TaxID=2608357 RepID=A0ABX0RF16_9GAMM|nr:MULTISPECIES: FxLYD domain-containing protein [Pantoea]NIF23961.1 hypothetical protein [Pantoea multigeneris]
MKKTIIAAAACLSLLSGVAIAAPGDNLASVADAHFSKGSNGITYVDGIVTNTTDHTLSMQSVKINLLKDGIVVGDTIGLGQNIEAGQRWKLHAPVNASETPDSFKVTEVLQLPH